MHLIHRLAKALGWVKLAKPQCQVVSLGSVLDSVLYVLTPVASSSCSQHFIGVINISDTLPALLLMVALVGMSTARYIWL